MSEIEEKIIFEFLSNEILIECFKYLNAFNLFYSFDGLNSRLNNLIRNIRLNINFEDVNKTIYDKFCEKMLIDSNIQNQIYSIEILNEDQCFQCNLFFSSFLPNKFVNLQIFISIYPLLEDKYHLKYYNDNDYQWIDDDQNIRLKIKQSDIPLSQLRVLSISNLTSFIPNINQNSIIIINLTILSFDLKDSQYLFTNFPLLKYLHIKFINREYINKTKILSNYQHNYHLKQLIIDQFNDTFENFEIFVKQTPNLKSLTFISNNTGDENIIDPNRWEYLIVSSIPKLNTFNFKCSRRKYHSSWLSTHESTIKRSKQFHSDFWQEQHHWYFEYIVENNFIYIYTIPYICDTYEIKFYFINSSNNLANTFVNVKNLTLKYEDIVKNSKYYFPNVTSLTLTEDYFKTMPIDDCIQYLKMMINLFKLKHLGIPDTKNASFLLEIFKQTPQLSSISISPNCLREILNDKDIFDYLTKMIKNFDLIKCKNSIDMSFKMMEDFCKIFPNIEHLQCRIYDTKNLFVIIDNLPKLSTLTIAEESGYRLREGASEPEDRFFEFKNEAFKRNITYDINVNRIEGDDRYGRYTPNYLIFTTLFIWIDNKLFS